MPLKATRIRLNSKDKKKGLTIPDSITPDLAYICGILVGDGSIYKRKEKNEYLVKCVGNPKDEKRLYNQIIGPKFKRVFGFIPKIGLKDQDTTYGFTIYSKSLFTFLTETTGLISGRKDQRLQIPTPIRKSKENLIEFIRGLFDTDGCITFKKRYRKYQYYPTIVFSTKSRKLAEEVSEILKQNDLQVVEIYDYRLNDLRAKAGFTVINRIEMNGHRNLRIWLNEFGFASPKHNDKIEKYWEEKK